MVTPRRKHLKKNRILITEKDKDPEIDLSQEDKMADLLTKMAVENFTKFLRLENKVEHTIETCKVIIIIMNFYSPVSNTRCHSIGHKK